MVVSIAIALILAFFVGYGIEVFDPSPKHEDFCPRDLHEIDNKESCQDQGGSWNIADTEMERPIPIKGFCQPSKKCYDQFEQSSSKHDRIVFITAAIIGLLSIMVGIVLKKDTVNTGVLSGGLLLILYGTIRYWRHADNLLKFVILGISLAILIWIGYKKLDK